MKRIVLLLLLMVLVSQPGCWDRTESEKLGLVQLVVLDRAPDLPRGVQITVQVINTSGTASDSGGSGSAGTGSNQSLIYEAQGITMFEAFRQLSQLTPRRLFYFHTLAVIVTDKLAEEQGLSRFLDFLDRNVQIRRNTWILVARSSEIGEILKLASQPEATVGQLIHSIINNRQLSSHYTPASIGEFLICLQDEGEQPETAGLRLVQEPRQTIQIAETAVFRGDKLVGWLDSKESRGFLWLKGKLGGSPISIPCPDAEGYVSLEFVRTSTKLKPRIENGQLVMEVEVSASSNLTETQCPIEFTPATFRRLEQAQNRAIEAEIRAAVTKLQALNSDAFGFGELYHRHFPREWQTLKSRWQEELPKVKVKITASSTIQQSGLIGRPAPLETQ